MNHNRPEYSGQNSRIYQHPGKLSYSNPGNRVYQPGDRMAAGRNYNRVYEPADRPQVTEETIRSETIQIERKTFVIALKENLRGRFLRITEGREGKHATLIIPATGLREFKTLIDGMVAAAEAAPRSSEPEEASAEDGSSPS